MERACSYAENTFEILHNADFNGYQQEALWNYEMNYWLELYGDEINQVDSCGKYKMNLAICLYQKNFTEYALELIENPAPEQYQGKLYMTLFNEELGQVDKVKEFLASDEPSIIDSLGFISSQRVFWSENCGLLDRAWDELEILKNYTVSIEDSVDVKIAECNLNFLTSNDGLSLIANYDELLNSFTCRKLLSDDSYKSNYSREYISALILRKYQDISWYQGVPIDVNNSVLAFFDVPGIPFCSTPSDTILNNQYRTQLVGTWKRIQNIESESGNTSICIEMEILDKYNALRRRYLDSDGDALQSTMYQYRLFRQGSQLYMDRFSSSNSERAIISIDRIDKDKLVFRCIYPNLEQPVEYSRVNTSDDNQ